mgnify:CR=1 FL=1
MRAVLPKDTRHAKAATHSARTARACLSEVVNRAAYGKERVVLSRRGKPMAVVVHLEDMKALEEMEDRLDAAEARAALAEHKASGEKGIPWETVKREAGL